MVARDGVGFGDDWTGVHRAALQRSATHGAFGPPMTHLPLRRLALTATLLGAPAAGQNSFRPLPSVPETNHSGAGVIAPVRQPRTYFEELDSAAARPKRERYVEVSGFADAHGASSLEGGGDVSMQHGGWSVVLGTELQGERLAAFGISTEAYFYNFGGGNALVPGASEPFNDLYRTRVSGVVRTPSSDGLGWFSGFELALSGEDEAPTNESLAVGGLGGVRYHAGAALDVELGVAAQSRLEDDPWFWPYIGVAWHPTDALTLEARGTSLEGRLALDRHWSLFGRADYELRQFRLNDDNAASKGVFRDEEIRAGLGLAHSDASGLTFELFGGVEVWRELSALDENGARTAEVEADGAPFVALKLSLSL